MLIVVAFGGLAIFFLYLFDPVRSGVYPICLLHAWTGLYCPGCGSLRALHCLLHGDLAAALRFNALFVLLVLIAAAAWPLRAGRRRWLWVLLAVTVAFGVLRNIARPPFSLLAPPSETAWRRATESVMR